MNSVKLSVLAIFVILFSCNANEKKHKYIKVGDKVIVPSPLTKYDSTIITKANESIVKIDSLVLGEFNCNRNIKRYDKFNNLKIEEFKITCLSDIRQVWSTKLFFGDNIKDTLLIISLDGLDNVLDVKR